MIKERMLRLAAQDLIMPRLLNREHHQALMGLVAEGKIVRDSDGRYVTPEVLNG